MSLPPSHFDALYAESPDPWGFAERWYERRKYALTMAALPRERYASAYEPGCSIGVLTGLLAERCDRLLASDGSPAAVSQAARRLADRRNVTVERHWLPDDWPEGSYDLVLLSELLFYLDGEDLDRVLRSAFAGLAVGGSLVVVHWRGVSTDHRRSGDDVHSLVASRAEEEGLVREVAHAETDFLIDVHTRR